MYLISWTLRSGSEQLYWTRVVASWTGRQGILGRENTAEEDGIKIAQEFRMHVLDRGRQNRGKEDNRILDRIKAKYLT